MNREFSLAKLVEVTLKNILTESCSLKHVLQDLFKDRKNDTVN